jgi:hypothetical protein
VPAPTPTPAPVLVPAPTPAPVPVPQPRPALAPALSSYNVVIDEQQGFPRVRHDAILTVDSNTNTVIVQLTEGSGRLVLTRPLLGGLKFNVTPSDKMDGTCRDKNIDDKTNKMRNEWSKSDDSKCLEVTTIGDETPFGALFVTSKLNPKVPVIIQFNTIAECDAFREQVRNMVAPQLLPAPLRPAPVPAPIPVPLRPALTAPKTFAAMVDIFDQRDPTKTYDTPRRRPAKITLAGPIATLECNAGPAFNIKLDVRDWGFALDPDNTKGCADKPNLAHNYGSIKCSRATTNDASKRDFSSVLNVPFVIRFKNPEECFNFTEYVKNVSSPPPSTGGSKKQTKRRHATQNGQTKRLSKHSIKTQRLTKKKLNR